MASVKVPTRRMSPPPPPGSKPPASKVAALVEAARGGDQEAFSELIRLYRHKVYALALYLTGDTQDADDIAQDAFLVAYKRLGEFRAESEFYTWVYRIALNLSLNMQRKNTRRRAAPLDDPRVTLAVQADSHGDPRRAAELKVNYTRLMAALDSLKEPMRATMILVSVQGLSHEAAASVLSCSTGTVAWRMHRARQQLAEVLGPQPPVAPCDDDSGLMRLLPGWVMGASK